MENSLVQGGVCLGMIDNANVARYGKFQKGKVAFTIQPYQQTRKPGRVRFIGPARLFRFFSYPGPPACLGGCFLQASIRVRISWYRVSVSVDSIGI